MGDEAAELSRRLLERHRTLGALLRTYANDDELASDLPTAAVETLRKLGAVLMRSLHDDAFEGPVMRSLEAVTAYLRVQMANLPREQFRVLHLDGDNRLLADKVMWTGTVDRVQIHVREVIRDLLDTGATALVLVHNHPSGCSAPSRADIAVTREIEHAAECLGAVVHDHIVLGRDCAFSMRANGMLRTEAAGQPGSGTRS